MSVQKILREMALIKAQVKDEAVKANLLAPLEAQLAAIAAENGRQLSLLPDESKDSKTPIKK